eukprot:SAG31_NODE_3800_length_3870_cov_2.092814_3_plen_62_part_00
MPCDVYTRPPQLDLDFGQPIELCHEDADGLFTREWSKATVTVNCNSYTSEIKLKDQMSTTV